MWFPLLLEKVLGGEVGKQEESSSPGFTEAGVTNEGKYILISSTAEDHVTSSMKPGAGWVGAVCWELGGLRKGAVSPCHPSKGWRK